ncbi:adenylate/guanylate cyclase domain-containing protein [Desulfobacterota bacterium AH_259_B03_O07]|nr:adenylate/guanylate cyclase domain-containing protein [Desulfobacterota bacterium AH_259_B03_O07]
MNDQLYKLRYKIKGPEEVWNGGQENDIPLITLVELDDRGYDKLEELKAIYGDRFFEADIINILNEADVSGIAYDTVFATEKEQSLIDATSKAKSVYFPLVLAPIDTSAQPLQEDEKVLRENLWNIKITRSGNPIQAKIYYSTHPELVQVAKGIGHINFDPDIDGIFRRVPLIIRHDGSYFPTISLLIAADYLGVKPLQIEVTFGKHILFKNAQFPDGTKRDIKIPIDDQGRTIINFAGNWLDVFRHISFVDVLDVLEDEDLLEILRDEIKDNLVIVADVSSRGKDFGATPLENFYPLSSVHANILNSILTINFIDDLDPWQKLSINILIIVIICVAAIKTGALVFSAITLLIFVLFIGFVLWLFLYTNTLTAILQPAIGIVLSFIFVNLYSYLKEEQEKAFLYQTFESYFAPSVMNKILKNPKTLESSERKVLTVLFSDISGFTAWSSTREPEEIHSTLNEYFSDMARIVFKYEGTIDKYMGDGMLAFFGDPIEYDDHALRAVKTAIDMQQKARELKKKWKEQGRLQIEMRIGINTGPVVVGNMGSENRVDYTVLGSEVNLAQRLEANAPLEGILISKSVYEELKIEEEKDKNKTKDIKTSLFGNINLKGITEEIEVYEVEVPELDKEPD